VTTFFDRFGALDQLTVKDYMPG